MKVQNYVSKKTHYLPEFVYRPIDETVTKFLIIAGVAWTNLSATTVVILGFSNVLVDGFSMTLSNYLSEQSHHDQNPDDNYQSPLKTVLAAFISFMIIGPIPVVFYIVTETILLFINNAFLFATICTGVTVISIGAVRRIISGKHPLQTSLEILAIGTITTLIVYGVYHF